MIDAAVRIRIQPPCGPLRIATPRFTGKFIRWMAANQTPASELAGQ